MKILNDIHWTATHKGPSVTEINGTLLLEQKSALTDGMIGAALTRTSEIERHKQKIISQFKLEIYGDILLVLTKLLTILLTIHDKAEYKTDADYMQLSAILSSIIDEVSLLLEGK